MSTDTPHGDSAPSFSTFQFSTIGKEPDLLRRISAPEPHQDYEDDSIDPSPSHSPTLEQKDISSFRPSLLQKLTHSSEINSGSTLSQLTNQASATQPVSSLFDPSYAALFRTSPGVVPSSSRPKSPTDMESISIRPDRTLPVPRSHLILTDGEADLIQNHIDSTPIWELTYPPTECSMSISPEPSNVRETPSLDAYASLDRELTNQLISVISYAESKTIQQSKVLDMIISLERDFQAVANHTSLALDKAQRAEAAAEKSLSAAKDAVLVAQLSVSAAKVAKIGADNALSTLAHLRQQCEDELVSDENACMASPLKRNIESLSRLLIGVRSRRKYVESSGLGPDLIHELSVEASRLRNGRELSSGLRKRKRTPDQVDSDSIRDVTCRLSKEARHEARNLFFDKTVEMEAEAAREAWIQEVERRSAVPPDTESRYARNNHRQEKAGADPTDEIMGDHRERVTGSDHDSHAQQPMDDIAVTPDKQETNDQNSFSKEGGEKKELKARWARELAEHKLEIAKFQMQEQGSQEKGSERKEETRADGIDEQKEQRISAKPPPVFVPATTLLEGVVERNVQNASKECVNAFKKKELELRLKLEKQRASPATAPCSSQAMCVAEASVPIVQGTQSQKAPNDGAITSQLQGMPDNLGEQQVINNSTTSANGGTLTNIARLKESAIDTPQAGNLNAVKAIPASSVGNVNGQKMSVPQKSASSSVEQRGSSDTSQALAGPAMDPSLLHANLAVPGFQPSFPGILGEMTEFKYPVNDSTPSSRAWNNDTLRISPQRISLSPIVCSVEANLADLTKGTKQNAPLRTSWKQRQVPKKGSPPKPICGPGDTLKMSTQHPTAVALPVDKNPPPYSILPKIEVVSPTLTQIQGLPPQHIQKPPSIGAQAVSTARQEREPAPVPANIAQPLHQMPTGSTKPTSRTESTEQKASVVQPVPKRASQPFGQESVEIESARYPSENSMADVKVSPPIILTQKSRNRHSESLSGPTSLEPASNLCPTPTVDPQNAHVTSGAGGDARKMSSDAQAARNIPETARLRPQSLNSRTVNNTNNPFLTNHERGLMPPASSSGSMAVEFPQHTHVPMTASDSKPSRSWPYRTARPSSPSPPRRESMKRPRNEVDHWSPRHDTRRKFRSQARPRIPSSSPPSRLRSNSPIPGRPLHQRLARANDLHYRPADDVDDFNREANTYHGPSLLGRLTDNIEGLSGESSYFHAPGPDGALGLGRGALTLQERLT